MFSSYQRNKKKTTYERVELANFLNGLNADTDEKILPITYAKNMYNFDYKNGCLETGLGLRKLYLPHWNDPEHQIREIDDFPYDVERVWMYRYYDHLGNNWSMIVAYCTDNHLYWTFLQDDDADHFIENRFTLSSCPVAVNYRLNGRDVLILCTKKDGMIIWDANFANGDPIIVSDAPKISSMCLQFDRLFACVLGDKSQVWYSEDLDPTNWNISLTEAGFITMVDEKGRLNKVVSFKDYVYIFRDYGISRIQETIQGFQVQQLYHSNSRIFPESVVVAGDCIMLLMEDGLYQFDGLNYERINLKMDSLFLGADNVKAEGVFHNGKYYLACNLNYPDELDYETSNFNTLLEYDLITKKVVLLRGVGIVSINTCHDETFSKLLVVCKHEGKQVVTVLEKNGQFFDVPLKKYWISPSCDLGKADQMKYVREMYISSKYDTTITLHVDDKKKTFNVKGKNSIQKLRVQLKGKLIRLEIVSSSANACISAPTLVVGYEE